MLSSRQPAKSSTYSLQVARLQASDLGAGMRVAAPRPAPAPPATNPAMNPLFNSANPVITALDRSIPLPATLRSLAIYLTVLILVASGMLLHVALAAQIRLVQTEIDQKEEIHAGIESQNAELVWEIARRNNLEQIQQAAYARGYRPINRRQYVYVPVPPRAPDTAAAVTDAPVHVEPRRAQPAPALAAATPIPEGRQLAQWWKPWQERIEEKVPALLERFWGSEHAAE